MDLNLVKGEQVFVRVVFGDFCETSIVYDSLLVSFKSNVENARNFKKNYCSYKIYYF